MGRMDRLLKIAVLLGGPSEEREVSLRSGRAVAAALRQRGHTVYEIDPVDRKLRLPDDVEVVFLALHGEYGEDGQVQAELEQLGIPYTGCGPEASRIAFNKLESKRRFLAAGVPTPEYTVIEPNTQRLPEGWAPPLVLKPIAQGSSIGLAFVETVEEFVTAMAEAGRFGQPVLVEKRILGREATVGILGDDPLPVVEVCPKSGRLDYHHKYTRGATEYYCPGRFDPETTKRIQQAALSAFHAIGGRDYARVDVMVDASGQPYVLEVNTLPGMTETSLLPMAAAQAGYSFVDLCEKMIEMALQRMPESRTRST